MKKSLLFIAPSLGGGGAERSLITLLSLIDYYKFEVDLYLFRREGLFLDGVPVCVKVLDGGNDYKYFDGDIKRCLLYCLKNAKFKLAIYRIFYMFALKKDESVNKRKLVWKYLSSSLPALEKQYDVSIGYLEGNSTYYCVDKTIAEKKIGYIHSDYKKLGMNTGFDEKYFEKLNSVATVSAACAESLTKEIPAVGEKTVVIENIISKTEISRLAVSASVFECGPEVVKLLTVARLSKEKGIDLALNACEILVNKGFKLCWYVAGTGELKDFIGELIKEKGLEKFFFLLGQQKNPYKYMAQCDIYIQPSRYEGKSIAVEEAKALAKPIVATRYSTVNDQIENDVTGVIAEIDALSIAEKVLSLINSPELASNLSANLKRMRTGNESEIERFYDLIDS